MPKLCSLCSSISFLDLPPYPEWIGGYHVPIAPLSEMVPHVPKSEEGEDGKHKSVPAGSIGISYHQSLEELQAAAKECEICALIEDSALRVKSLFEEALETPRFAYYDKSEGPNYELGMTKRREGEDGVMVWSMAKKSKECYLMGAIGFCVDDESLLRSHFRGRPVLEDPGDPVSLNRLRTWLKGCQSNHSKCNFEPTPLPSRVLDLADPALSQTQIRLVEPALETTGHYAALSHCWGVSRQFTTTKATLEARKSGIDVPTLPKTFQDAVTVTRELGVRYLWLDSLCICQDDGSDWERESAKMLSIYTNAYFTIAASRSGADSTGFLTPREKRKYVKLSITLGKSGGEVEGELQLFNLDLAHAANGSHYVVQEYEPLSTRGWALQERYLAPRTFLFGERQTCYECQECFETEDGYVDTDQYFDIHNEPKEPAEVDEYHRRQHRKASQWYPMLYQYSHRKLSREEDKLPAMSGLARLFEGKLGDEYIAGLWKGDLIEGLSFQCFGGAHSRPKEWRAPSWSWASVDGILNATTLSGWTDFAEVRNVRADVKGQNPYGEIRDAVLEIDSVLERVWPSEEKEKDEDKVPHTRHVRFRFEDGNAFGHYMSPDVETDRQKIREWEAYVLPLALDERKEGADSAYVLFLVPDETHKGAYRREGFAFVGDENVLKRWKEAKSKRALKTVPLV